MLCTEFPVLVHKYSILDFIFLTERMALLIFFAVVNHFLFLSRLVAIHLVDLYLYILQGTEQQERTRVLGTRDIER
jgi:hypothetical protein